MYTYIEMSQWNSLYSDLKQTKISFFKNGEPERKTGPVWGLVVDEGVGYKERV
jgi:hypothetical protein